MQKRWYDLDPTVSLAVSLMKSADLDSQVKCAEYIISKAKNHGIHKQDVLNTAITIIMRRWYDKDKRIQEAFDYFKSAPVELQREIALQLISVLQVC